MSQQNYIKQIRSPKHPGAVFIKERASRDNFICKVYPGHEDAARVIIEALEASYNPLMVCPNCDQWQRPENDGDCLNQCKKRGFA